MKICIVTELDRPGGSIYVMAHEMQSYYQGAGHTVELTGKKGPLSQHFEVVVNLVPKYAADLMNSRRYMSFDKLVNVFTPNVEEFPVWELARMFTVMGPSCYWVAHSPFNARNIKTFVKDMFSPGLVRNFEGVFSLVPGGISAGDFKAGKKNNNFLIAPFNRLTDMQKNIKLHSEITEKFLFSARVKKSTPFVELYLCEAFDKKHSLNLTPYTVMKQPENRGEYLAKAAKCAAFLCTSNYESLGLYYLELLAAGAVGVFLDREWARSLLDDYPLIVKKELLLTTLLWVHEKPVAAQELVAPFVQKLKERYTLSAFCKGVLAVTPN